MTRRFPLAAALVLSLGMLLVQQQRPAAQNFQLPPGARAEAPDPNIPLYFEAASVKPNKEGGQGMGIGRRPGGRLNTTNTPVNLLITFAYVIQGYQLIGAPDWARNERYDIVAKLEGDPAPVTPPAPDHMMLAMRTLLADRFKLKVHTETREMDIYALVMARPGGKPGPALKVSTDMCGQRQGIGAPRPEGGAPPAPPTRPDGTPIFCGMRQQAGRVQFNGMPMTQFASGIAQRVGRAVVDRTGLTGEWSFELTFAPQQAQVPPGAELPAADPNTPDLFTAVQEQLGLKLEATKGPVEVLVVDSIERPTAD
jgi:uncharacterized protein (TIGR03435 family)